MNYFREIFDQNAPPLYGGYDLSSCAQAAGVAYTFCYEINRYRDLNVSYDENKYPQTYTYNYMNGAETTTATIATHGWDIIENNGCPNMIDWGTDNFYDYLMWMDGYDKYLNGIRNRINSYSYMDIDQQGGLTDLKQWLYNHNRGDFI